MLREPNATAAARGYPAPTVLAPDERAPSRALRFGGGMLLGAVLVLYVRTLAPGVLGGDSAELQYVARLWGIPHPTSYPTYVLATRPFAVVPVGELAWRINLFSALCSAFAVALVFRVLRELGSGATGAFVGAGCLAVGRAFWSQAVIAEVHGLNELLLAGLLALVLRWDRERSTRALVDLALVAALALGCHMTTVVLLPVLAAFVLVRGGARRPALAAGAAATTLALGALLYFVLAWLAIDELRLSGIASPRVWSAILDRVTARQYQESVLAYGLADQPARLAFWGRELVGQYTVAGAGLVAVGLFARLELARRLLLAATFVVAGVVAMNLRTPDAELYLLPAHVVAAVLLGLGADRLVRFAGRRGARLAAVASALCVALPLALVLRNHAAADRSDDVELGRWGRALLARLEPGSIVVAGWTRNTTLHYLQSIEGRGAGVEIALSGALDPAQLAAAATARPVYLVEPEPWEHALELEPGPGGVWRVVGAR